MGRGTEQFTAAGAWTMKVLPGREYELCTLAASGGEVKLVFWASKGGALIMKTKHSFLFALMTFFAVVVMGVFAWAAPAPPKPKPLSCSLIGTWSGWADRNWSDGYPSLAWIAVQTAGSNPTSGGIVMNWVPTPGDMFLGYGAHLTPGQGLWQQNGSQFNYTWYAYLVGDDPNNSATYGLTIGSIRVYGIVVFASDCNNANISYTLDMFSGVVSPDKMTLDNPNYIESTSGYSGETSAGETRAPLVVPAP
jgi:hypothetical protein